jgi:hypothetical protein
MIHTGLDDISRAKTIAGKVIQEVRFWRRDFNVRCICSEKGSV